MFTLCCGASVRLTKADGTEAGAKRSQEKLFFLGSIGSRSQRIIDCHNPNGSKTQTRLTLITARVKMQSLNQDLVLHLSGRPWSSVCSLRWRLRWQLSHLWLSRHQEETSWQARHAL